jgi:hypothetical protein
MMSCFHVDPVHGVRCLRDGWHAQHIGILPTEQEDMFGMRREAAIEVRWLSDDHSFSLSELADLGWWDGEP